MTDPILKTIVRLISLFVNIDKEVELQLIYPVISDYLRQYTNSSNINDLIEIFKFYNLQYKSNKNSNFLKEISIKSVKLLRLINNINTELEQKDKFDLFFVLLKILQQKNEIIPDEIDFLQTVALSFNISNLEYNNLIAFALKEDSDIINNKNVLVIDSNNKISENRLVRHLQRKKLNGSIYILNVSSVNIFLFYYTGNDQLFINGNEISKNSIYEFKKGNSISSYKMGLQNVKLKPIYYTEVGMEFVNSSSIERIHLSVKDLTYKHNKNTYGIRPFSFNSESYLFVGIIGSSGVGKTTMLNVLNGNLKPNKGQVLLNGHNIHDRNNKELFNGLIGYVPQDDLLIDELTVFQNLYFSAKLCFADYSEEQINLSVENVLSQLDLLSIKDLKVGKPLEKVISGGQRKRLNIGLEIMRSPSVLLIDEPTSGLSSNDSLNIINLLRELTLQGKLVIVNIHQPSSNIYKFFDQLLVMDTGGRVVYSGDPMEAIVYFKTLNNQVNASEKECPYCGNVNTEIILEIITEKILNDNGQYTNKRKTPASKWYSKYKENIDSKIVIENKKYPLPKNKLKIPNKINQFKIFSYRNLLTKLENKQYMLISLLEAPLLAIILGYFSKYIIGTENDSNVYIFSENVNIPSFFLMGILVAIFMGLLISAEEIIKDKKLLEREKFLNLSRKSYLNSKIVYLFCLSAIQIFLFVIISNHILQIKGLTFQYWLILFSTICFANMLGLNISSGLKSVIAIYILIPFLIMPQILLSGTIIEFDKLHNKLTSKLYPPVIADLMASRWAYEALAVTQFKNNEYEKNFYNIEKEESEASFYLNVLIPELISLVDECETHLITDNNYIKAKKGIEILKNELPYFKKIKDLPEDIIINKLSLKNLDKNLINIIREYLTDIRFFYSSYLDQALYKKDKVINTINSHKNYESVQKLKQMYFNKSLSNLVKQNDELEKVIKYNNKLIRKMEPIYIAPVLNNGRAHYYAPYKKIMGIKCDTYLFNVMILWIFTLILYITLRLDLLKQMINLFDKKKLK